ncbi:MAG: bifunctional serine/threonine-protein kinase/formylglycine-generating enzyme family protein [Planctomycetota bacterium]|nr:bifunctional serine/threonine-protein kinase/formylglycine-generating enzyme family protein [Planctomycetota bacterium]
MDKKTAPAYAFQDLTNDPLLVKAPRMEYAGAQRPSLGGIPLLAKIGQGGMGAVYYGLHPVMGVAVAVKVLPLHLVGHNPDMAKRFVREAQIAGSINSANLIYVRDVGQDGGYFYQVMEYVRGVSAGAYLRLAQKSGRKGLKQKDALEVCIAAARGLVAAHTQNIIHRDIKPDNILIPTIGESKKLRFSAAKVADLGLARTQHAESAPEVAAQPSASREGGTLTGAGRAMGTLGYMPPEQIDDARSVGKTADVFALGATLYALLAGHAPFEGKTSTERVLETILGRREPLAQARPDVSPATAAMVERCLRKEPAERFPDGAALVEVLERSLAALEAERKERVVVSSREALVAAPAAAAVEARAKSARTPARVSWRTRAAMGAATLMLAVLAGVLVMRNGQQKPETVPPDGASLKRETAGARPETANLKPETAGVKPETKPWPLHDGKEGIDDYAKRVNLPATQTLDLGNGMELELVLIPAGKFLMGSPATQEYRHSNETQHEVTISKPFYMGRYEVIQEQYEAVMGNNPSKFKGAKNPVETVSWNDAQEFCKKASAVAQASGLRPQSGGLRYAVRLPTEAEWEYACRAGTTSPFHTGETISKQQANYGNYEFGHDPKGRVPGKTVPVGSYAANLWGLYDMHGNVWEWCQDWYGEYAPGAATDPKGAADGDARVCRGGSWDDAPDQRRSAHRSANYPYNQHDDFGFRCALDVAAGIAPAPETQPDAKPVQPETTNQKPHTGPWPLHDGKEPVPDYARRVNLPATQALDLGNGVKLELVLIPAGKFLMGSPETEEGRNKDETQHEVMITKPFYMGKYEVTQEQHEAVTGKNPSTVEGVKNPVWMVSWYDAQDFCKKATAILSPDRKVAEKPLADARGSQFVVRLPTEAEWEYACRAGTRTRFCSGDADSALADVAWYRPNSGNNTHPAGQKKPNAWDLYDMHGNVWEWCQDWYDDGYPRGAATDPKGATSGNRRVLRGGCLNDLPVSCRSARRRGRLAELRDADIGFRVVVGCGSSTTP